MKYQHSPQPHQSRSGHSGVSFFHLILSVAYSCSTFILPKDFREEFGAEILEDLRDELLESGENPFRQTGFIAYQISSLAILGMRMRLRSTFREMPGNVADVFSLVVVALPTLMAKSKVFEVIIKSAGTVVIAALQIGSAAYLLWRTITRPMRLLSLMLRQINVPVPGAEDAE